MVGGIGTKAKPKFLLSALQFCKITRILCRPIVAGAGWAGKGRVVQKYLFLEINLKQIHVSFEMTFQIQELFLTFWMLFQPPVVRLS